MHQNLMIYPGFRERQPKRYTIPKKGTEKASCRHRKID